MSDKLAGGIKAGATSVSIPVELRKSADSLSLTGIVYSGVTASYWRQGGVRTAITTATLGSVNAAYSSGGFVEVDATNMPGVYRFDVPDAAFASGAEWVVITLVVSTAFTQSFMFALESSGAAEVYSRIGAAGVGLTNLGDTRIANLDATVSSRNATTPPTSSAIASQVRTELTTELGRIDAAITTRSSHTAADVWSATTRTLSAFGFSVTVGTNNDKTGYTLTVTPPTAATIAAAVCDEALSGHTTAGTVGKKLTDITNLTASDVWAAATRTLTAFGFSVTVGTNNDKTGYTLTVTPPTAAQVATEVRTELTTELGRIDVAVSSRNATTPPTASAIADQVWDEVLSGHLGAGSTGAALNAAGSAGDPWSTVVPGAYGAGTAGALFGKLDVGEAEEPVIVLPSAPVDLTMCRVYGYLETIDNQVAAGVSITFELVISSPAASNKLLSGRKVTITTDAQGRISDGVNAYLDLQRNDLIEPAGSVYKVTSRDLGMDRVEITLDAETFDLKSIV